MGRRKVGGHDYVHVVTAAGTRYRLCPIEASYGRFNERPSGRETRCLAVGEGGDSLLCPSMVDCHRGAITSSFGMLTKWRQSTRLATRTKESTCMRVFGRQTRDAQ